MHHSGYKTIGVLSRGNSIVFTRLVSIALASRCQKTAPILLRNLSPFEPKGPSFTFPMIPLVARSLRGSTTGWVTLVSLRPNFFVDMTREGVYRGIL